MQGVTSSQGIYCLPSLAEGHQSQIVVGVALVKVADAVE